MKSEGKDVIGFGAGEPDFDTPEHIKEAAIRAIRQGFTKYTPASGTPELKQAVCQKLYEDNGLFYEAEQVVISNGAKHSLNNIFAALLNNKDEVIIPAPYWVSYPELVKLHDGTPVIVFARKENNFKLTAEEFKKALTSNTKALVINTPSNPTGQVYKKAELEKLAEVCVENNIIIISDEVYERLIYGSSSHISPASLGEEAKKLTIVVNGVSKAFSMTGWRIGYAASEKAIAKAMSDIQGHATSNPNSIAQKAAYAALDGPGDCVEEMRQAFEKRKNFMLSKIQEMPFISCIKPEGAFYIFLNVTQTFGKQFRGKKIQNGEHLAELLLENYRVALVPGRGFGAPEYVRISFANSMENIIIGLERIEAFLTELE